MTVEGVGRTAIAVAAARALEDSRPDALVRDPFAARVVAVSGIDSPFPSVWTDATAASPLEASMMLGATYIGLRTRFIDDELLRVARPQVVVLGSGLDTRSWRLPWPEGTVVFELDSAAVLDVLESALAGAQPTCTRVALRADVTGPWTSALIAAGFDPATPTHWVMEGLLPYLAAHDQGALFDDIAVLSATGSRIVLERAVPIEDTPEARERLRAFAQATGLAMDEVLSRTDPPDPVEVLTRAGWRVESVAVGDLEARYSRSLGASPSRGGFVTAIKS